MKKLQILALAMLFAMTGIDVQLQAKKGCSIKTKGHCHRGCEWRNNKCRSKPSTTDNTLTKTNNDQLVELDIAAGEVNPIDNNGSAILGADSSTYAPQIFQPDAQFTGQGLIGNYFSSSNTATIQDPSGTNSTSYLFTDVLSMSGNMRPIGLTHIGSFKTPGYVPSKVYCSGCPNGTTDLYGNLVSNDQQ